MFDRIKRAAALFLTFVIVLSSLAGAAGPGLITGTDDRRQDDTGEQYKTINDAPAAFVGQIQITTKDASKFRIEKTDELLIIYDKEKVDKRVKLKFHENVLKKLPGYNGKEFSYVHVTNAGIIDSVKIIKTADVVDSKTGYIELETDVSEVIIGGATGYYDKTVQNIDYRSTEIPFSITGSSLIYGLIETPPAYMEWDESNISTYPGTPDDWFIVWTFNNNSNDITGNGFHGTVAGSGVYVNDRNGQALGALDFDGDGDYVYVDNTDTALDTATAVWIYYLESATQYCTADFRNATGGGHTSTYTHETKHYINNDSTADQSWYASLNNWSVAAYPMNETVQTNVFRVGRRYATTYYYLNGSLDMAGLYEGLLTADDVRVFTHGYNGIKLTALPGGTPTPVLSTNQSVTAPANTTGVLIESNVARTDSVRLIGLFTNDYTKTLEDINYTVDYKLYMEYTPQNNVTEADLLYEMVSGDHLQTPSIESTDPGASVLLIGDNLHITTGELEEDTTYYYNVTMLYDEPTEFITTSPATQNISIPLGTEYNFNVTTGALADVIWSIGDGEVETDLNTTAAGYVFEGTELGEFALTASTYNDSEMWFITVTPNTLTQWTPTDLTQTVKNSTNKEFTATADGPVNFVWLLNSTPVQYNNTTTYAEYIFNESGLTDFNLTVDIGTDDKTWIITTVEKIEELIWVVESFVVASFVAASAVVASYFNKIRKSKKKR